MCRGIEQALFFTRAPPAKPCFASGVFRCQVSGVRCQGSGVRRYYFPVPISSLTNIFYSDGTPAVSFTLDRLGRQVAITDGTGTRSFSYNDALQLAAETNAFGTITRYYDSFGRSSGLAVGANYQVGYGYSSDGRFSAVTSSVQSVSSVVNYSYLPNSDLISGWSNGILATVKNYEAHRDLISSVANTFNGQPIGAFAYANDALARRVGRVDNGAITNTFGYNPRSELSSARMGTNSYGYLYDAIGNRTAATNNAVALTYTANALNQYTSITNGGIRTLAYDLDGNLTNDSAFAYTWDGENRLVSAEQVGTAVPAVRFAYDYMSRRVEKAVNSVTNRFVYDGWNLISETTSTGVTNAYVWGLDLSGSLQGAGGIGGLMAVVRNGQTYHPVADANGNITDYVASNGIIVAHYEFDAFGNTVEQSGTLADAFAYRFSTKYTDDETGLIYYGYRYYSQTLGRWVSRDPVNEEGFRSIGGAGSHHAYRLNEDANLFRTDDNRPLDRFDMFGLYTLSEAEASLSKKGVPKAVKGWIWDSYSDEQIFNEWLALEKASTAWVSALPKCPKCVIISAGKANNPDATVWTDPNPGFLAKMALAKYHPGAVYEVRNVKGAAGAPSGNQCTYDAKGILMTTSPAAGSADLYGPQNDFGKHQSHDVKTFDSANSLKRVTDYYSVRPIW